MARIDPSRQVSMVGFPGEIIYWAKRPNKYTKQGNQKTLIPGFSIHTLRIRKNDFL